MDEELVSLEMIREHYGIWRWRIERESSKKFVEIWTKINAANIDDDTKLNLANVAWALAGFERTYDVLAEDIARAEAARNVGVPPVMEVLTEPYPQSLDYLIVVSLWMDLADVLVSYRTIADRFGHLRNAARRNKIVTSISGIEHEIGVLEARKLPELSSKRIRKLADTILHHSWHPRGAGPRDPVAAFLLVSDRGWLGQLLGINDTRAARFRPRRNAPHRTAFDVDLRALIVDWLRGQEVGEIGETYLAAVFPSAAR